MEANVFSSIKLLNLWQYFSQPNLIFFGFASCKSMNRCWITILSLLIISHLVSAKVLLIGKNIVLSFDDVEATFTPIVQSSGECGLLYTAEPLDACSDLTYMVDEGSKYRSSYVLIIRGGCSFEEKVRNAQKAGFKAVIVYNNRHDELLVPMGGNSSGVHIHGVFVTRASGEVLKRYAGRAEMELWLIPGYGISSGSIMAITFMSLFAISVVLAIFLFFCKHHRIRRRRVRVMFLSDRGRRDSRIPSYLLQSMPTEVFTGVFEECSTSVTCAVCIDDYCLGDKLKILPCQHKFHAACIDSWLGHCRSFCPVCKRDARTSNGNPPPSEQTPLLSPSLSTSTSLPSLPIAIRQEPLSRSTAPQPHTVPMYQTQDLRNAFPQRFTYRTSRVSASSSWAGSSSTREDLLDQSELVGSFPILASTNSLLIC